MIEVKNLTFQYQKNMSLVLDNLSFSLEEGSVLSILGKNGVGKTTFLRCLTSEITAYSGEILVCSKEVRSFTTSELSQIIAIVASNNPCYQNLSVADFLVTGFANQLTSLRSPSKEQYEKAAAILGEMGQIDLLNRTIFQLSSGEMQIVKIARAILQNPRVIVFDEPTSNLDIKNQLLVLEQITALSKQGYTVITTTHNPGQSIELGDMVLMLSDEDYFYGKANDALNIENLGAVYGLNVSVEELDERRFTIFRNENNTHKLFF